MASAGVDGRSASASGRGALGLTHRPFTQTRPAQSLSTLQYTALALPETVHPTIQRMDMKARLLTNMPLPSSFLSHELWVSERFRSRSFFLCILIALAFERRSAPSPSDGYDDFFSILKPGLQKRRISCDLFFTERLGLALTSNSVPAFSQRRKKGDRGLVV